MPIRPLSSPFPQGMQAPTETIDHNHRIPATHQPKSLIHKTLSLKLNIEVPNRPQTATQIVR